MVYKEKRFTFLTELGMFLDFDIVNIHVQHLSEKEFCRRSNDFK